MLKIKGLMFGTILGIGSLAVNHVNADTLQPCSCWTSGNTIKDGAKCYAKGQFQATTWESIFTYIWLPADCLSWCNATWTQEQLNTYVFYYYDWHSYNVCDGDAIYDKNKFINRTPINSSASETKARADKIKAYLKAHPMPSKPLPLPQHSIR